MAYYITKVMLGQVGHGSDDINKFYRNFFWLKLKAKRSIFLTKMIQIGQLTNATLSEIPLRRR